MSARDQYYYARELMACGETARAEQAFGGFLGMDGWLPNVLDAHVQRGRCLEALGRDAQARREYLLTAEHGAPPAEALCALGGNLMRSGDLDAAAFWFRAALECEMPIDTGAFVDPDAYGYVPLMQLCVIYDRKGETARAREMNERALALRPGDEAALFNRAYFEKKLGAKR